MKKFFTSLSIFAMVVLVMAVPAFASAAGAKDNHTYKINKIEIINTTEIQLFGNRVNFDGRSIQIRAQNGITLQANYDSGKKVFVLAERQTLIPGMNYTIFATWARIPGKVNEVGIANLTSVHQIASNKIELVYDRPVDLVSATKTGNYWIKNNLPHAADIAELGMNDPVTANNALTPEEVSIIPIGHTRTRFIMIFNDNATPGTQYTVIPCGVNTFGSTGYMGGNFNSSSMDTFVADNFQ
jgi:hypothetical protein